jgi:hypothetical protein
VDFSFVKCLTPSLNEPIKLFHSSARRAIAGQVVSFRDRYFIEKQDDGGNVACMATGVLIDKNSSHVDHIPPDTFYKIVSDFIAGNNIDVNGIEFIETTDGIGREFADKNLKNAFADYHRNVANLRVISPLANLKQKKK